MNIMLPAYATRSSRPRLAKHVIGRNHVIAKLQEAVNYPLTVVRAGAGYGKSTLINQAFPDTFTPTVWLHLSEQDNGAIPFLSHLVQVAHNVCPTVGLKALPLLVWDERQGNPDALTILEALVDDLFLAGPLVIILDDYQYMGDNEDVLRLTGILVDRLPDNVHVVIASREKVNLPGIALKRAKGDVLDIGEPDLAFTAGDISRLFSEVYKLTVDDVTAGQLAARTEGWIMAIQMLGQNMKKGWSWDAALKSLPQSLSELFEFLAQDYLTKQPASIRSFLFHTAYLELLKPDICNHLLDLSDSAAILRDFERRGLFTFRIGDGVYRYHHLFQEFLQKNGGFTAHHLRELHGKAARWYKDNEPSQAINHYLAGGYHAEAGELMKDHYLAKLAAGQQAELARWLELLPPKITNTIPELLLARGDIYRLAGDFANALKLYRAAEKSFSAAGNTAGSYLTSKAFALVYLDTVQPVEAEKYLAAALKLADERNIPEQARLYQLVAENKVNLGRAEEAAAYFVKANELFLEDSRGDVEARMHLRTGRLLAAKQILARRTGQCEAVHTPKSHRETPLLLSLINSFMGDVDEAWRNAQAGLNTGTRFKAVFVEAVGYMRLGHAKQLKSWLDTEEAIDCYQQALEIVSSLEVERGKAEPLCGLCILYGHQGNLDSAVRYGLEGIRVGRQSQDDWITAMVELSLTIAYYKAGMYDKADEWGNRSYASFTLCGDSYLSAVTLLWRTLLALERGKRDEFRRMADALFYTSQTHDYDFIFHKPTFLGFRDVQAAMPLLLAAQKDNIRPEYVGSLLTELGLSAELTSHPGYTLRVQTLGPFITWRGIQEIKAKEWQREKAKRLFQYFLTNRKTLVHKEQLTEAIWSEEGSDSDFKVAMNAMINALEPNRHARKAPFYIAKNESTYGLNLAAGIIIDVDEFESYISRGRRIEKKDPEQAIRLYRLALNLYKGDFLQECCYEDWCLEERERLLILYLTTAERMAYMLYERGEIEECMSLCTRILGKDRCWEGAYVLLMRCYYQQNNRAMVAKVFKHCQENLKGELGVAPADETVDLYRKLTQ